jgi:hypothetical protein
MKQCASLKEMAEYWGMSKRTLDGWSADGLLHPGPNGKWKSQDVARILKAKEAEAEKAAKADPSEYSEKKLKYQALRAKLEYETAAGLKIDKSEVERREVEICAVFKAALLGVGRSLAPRLEHMSQLEIARELEEWAEDTIRKIESANQPKGKVDE